MHHWLLLPFLMVFFFKKPEPRTCLAMASKQMGNWNRIEKISDLVFALHSLAANACLSRYDKCTLLNGKEGGRIEKTWKNLICGNDQKELHYQCILVSKQTFIFFTHNHVLIVSYFLPCRFHMKVRCLIFKAKMVRLKLSMFS